MTLVDGGLPGFRPQLDDYLRSRGRSLADIDAVILTHAHSDHIGMVERVRTDAPATVYVHEVDEQMARTGKVHKRDGTHAPLPAPPGGLQALLSSAVASARARTPNDHRAEHVHRRRPRRPRAARGSSRRPGHSPGHVAFHLPDRGVLIAGDALCTYNPLTGKRGPQLMPRAFASDIAAGAGVARRARAHRGRACCSSATASPGPMARPRRSRAPENSGSPDLRPAYPGLGARSRPQLEHGNAHLRAPARGRGAAHRPPPRDGVARPCRCSGSSSRSSSLGGVVWWATQQDAPTLPDTAGEIAALLGAIALYGLATVVRAERWQRLLVDEGAKPHRADTYALTVVGYAGNNILPARAGDAIRVVLMAPRARDLQAHGGRHAAGRAPARRRRAARDLRGRRLRPAGRGRRQLGRADRDRRDRRRSPRPVSAGASCAATRSCTGCWRRSRPPRSGCAARTTGCCCSA